MAKKKVSLQRTGAFALAMTTALSTLSFSAANAAQSSHDTDTIDVPDTDTVTKVITDYQATLDREWTDSSASTGASTLTSAEQTVHYIRDGLIEDGVPVTSASSEVRIVEITTQGNSGLLVTADISTTKTYGGSRTSGRPGVWTDRHDITLAGNDGDGYSVTEDTVTSREAVGDPNDVPEGYDPQRSSDTRITDSLLGVSAGVGAGGTSVSTALPAYNTNDPDVQKMVDYAAKWTSSPNDGDGDDDFNHDFPIEDNNCANFASQVLHAGGWDYDDFGINPYSTVFWGPDLLGPAGPSRTWVNAAYQYTYVDKSSYDYLDNIWNATAGDLLYVDWDPDGKADGDIDHVMVVTSNEGGEPGISQKTPNRSDIPLSESIRNAMKQGKSDIVWYGLKR